MMLDHQVFFVQRDFDGDLWLLSRGAHVWLAQSAVNEEAARRVWDRETSSHSPLSGVSTFAPSGDCLVDFYQFLGTIDEHHNKQSASPPWRVIHVRGVCIEQIDADRIRAALGSDEFRIVPESDGFAILRAAQPGDA